MFSAVSAYFAKQSIPPDLRKTVDLADFEREIPIKEVLMELHGANAWSTERERGVQAAMDLSKGVSLSLKDVVRSQESLEQTARRGYDQCIHEWVCVERQGQSLVRGAVLGRLKRIGAPLGES